MTKSVRSNPPTRSRNTHKQTIMSVSLWRSCAQNVPNKLVSSLFRQKKAGKYCDMTLAFGQVEMNAHACVVASFSVFVDNFFSSRKVMPPSGGTAECPIPKLNVPLSQSSFTCVDCASKVIDFMYVGKIQIDDEHLEHIRAASEGLQVSELLKICKKHSSKCFSESEATICAAQSSEHGSKSPKSRRISLSQHDNTQLVIESAPKGADLEPTCSNKTSITNQDDVMDESEWCGMKCPKCDLVFLSLAKFQQHSSTHLGKTYTTCFVCNYASIRVPDVIKHLQEENHGEKVCSLCLLEVNSSQLLKEHLQMHDQTQPFFCLTCSTRFQTRTALNSHIVRHTNETPFVCKECGRGFKWKHGLRSHMVTHSKLKTLLCDQCGFSTAHLKSFIDHKMIHSGEKFKCPKPDCQFESVRKESVKHHLMTHSKQKPYQCEICGQAFSQSKNLRRHAALHNPSADPERCPLCTFQTTRSDKFKAHFKRFHKDGEEVKGNDTIRRKKKNVVSNEDTSHQNAANNNGTKKKCYGNSKKKKAEKGLPKSVNRTADGKSINELIPITSFKSLEEPPLVSSNNIMLEGSMISGNLDLSSIPTIIIDEILLNESSSTSVFSIPTEWQYHQIISSGKNIEDLMPTNGSDVVLHKSSADAQKVLQDLNTIHSSVCSLDGKVGNECNQTLSAKKLASLPSSSSAFDSPIAINSNSEGNFAISSQTLPFVAKSTAAQDLISSVSENSECTVSVSDISATSSVLNDRCCSLTVPEVSCEQLKDKSHIPCRLPEWGSNIGSHALSSNVSGDLQNTVQNSDSSCQEIFVLNPDEVTSLGTYCDIPDGSYVVLETDSTDSTEYSIMTIDDPSLNRLNNQTLEEISCSEVFSDTVSTSNVTSL